MRRTWWVGGAAVVVLVAFALAVLALRDDGPGGHAVALPPAAGSAAREDAEGPPLPLGQADGWEMAFSDEFDGSTLDTRRWADQSGAEADNGRGNKQNKQLEWNQGANCAVNGGELTMTARREAVTSPSGERYEWTSCLISSTPSYGFRYGYVEERAILPRARGFWPALWTWQAPFENRYIETDVYEFYSETRHRLDLTQHSGAGGNCKPALPFDPADGWHTYGAAIEPSGTTWYVDGVEVCRTPATSDGVTNIVSNLAVFAEVPPAASTTEAVKRVDHVRAWERP